MNIIKLSIYNSYRIHKTADSLRKYHRIDPKSEWNIKTSIPTLDKCNKSVHYIVLSDAPGAQTATCCIFHDPNKPERAPHTLRNPALHKSDTGAGRWPTKAVRHRFPTRGLQIIKLKVCKMFSSETSIGE